MNRIYKPLTTEPSLVDPSYLVDPAYYDRDEPEIVECPWCGENVDKDNLRLGVGSDEMVCYECSRLSSCCGAKLYDDTDICSDCKEHV